jgi:hypothetical protein
MSRWPKQTWQQRFWSKVALPNEQGCMLWLKGLNGNGYGAFQHNGQMLGAHRIAYELLVGPIPEGMVIDHVKARGCTNRHCVAPDHLEAVTGAENTLRGGAAQRTHCPKGHPYSGENLLLDGKYRKCRTCCRRRDRERRPRGRKRVAA